MNNVLAKHGLSKSIAFDRDPRFTSAFWKELFTLLGTELKLSTAHHPQTDRQTERMNRLVEDRLCVFVSHRQDDWDEILPPCEFAIHNSNQSSTGETPFFLNYGQHPLTPASLLDSTSATARTTRILQQWLVQRSEDLQIAKDAVVAAQARQALTRGTNFRVSRQAKK